MALADARAQYPDLAVADADPVGDRAALIALADWGTRYTPWAVEEKDNAANFGGSNFGGAGLWLDLSGSADLFGGEAALLNDLTSRLAEFGFASRAAIADTPGAAWAAARCATRTIVAPGESRAALAALPVAGLRLDPTLAARLRHLGLRRIGDLYDLPRAQLTRRFGALLSARLDAALGHASEPISPRRPVPLHRSRLGFAEPIANPSDILAGTERLIDDIVRRLAADGRGARRIELTLYRSDGRLEGAEIGTSRPTRDRNHLLRLFREKMEKLDPGFGIDLMILSVLESEGLAPVQARFASGRMGLEAESDDDLAHLVDRLGNRLGPAGVRRIETRPNHVPERADRAVSALSPPDRTPEVSATIRSSPLPPRPLHLLPMPERVEVMAEIPDGPPALFRWRRNVHRVRRAEGPERIMGEWWMADATSSASPTRDYFRVEDEDGRRFWLYRDGIYREIGREIDTPVWYLHGLFA